MKKTRGPKGPSVLPRAAVEEEKRRKRGAARGAGGGARRAAGPQRSDRPDRSDRPKRSDRPRFEKPDRARTDRARTDRPRTDRPRPDRPRADRPARFDRRPGGGPPRPGGERRHGQESSKRTERGGGRPPRRGFKDRPRDSRPPEKRGTSGGPAKWSRHGGGPARPGGRRFARPQRYDAQTGRPTTALLDAPSPARDDLRSAATRRRGVAGAPAATTPRRGPNVRDLALQVLFQVDVKRAYAERVIEDLAEQFRLDRRDRAFLNELVKGTLRRRGTLDYHLNRFLHVGLASLPVWIQNALRLGAYQLAYLDRVPPRAAVDESVKLALKYGHPGTAGLSNSVLRRLSEAVVMRELAPPAVTRADGSVDYDALIGVTSHPRWLLERWVARYGVEETIALCEANNRTAALGLRANRLRLDRKELVKRLEAAGLTGRPGRWSSHTVWVEADADFSDFPAYTRGDCTVQDESETLVGFLVAPASGERVLDLCAAPGGKSTHLAELMGDHGEVVAVEKLAPRARTMQRGIERLGLRSIAVEVADGTEADLRSFGRGGPYDRALVDAPCSGIGVLARRADARWRKEAGRLVDSAELQGRLLRAAAQVVRPGGVLVYSVCSFEPEETDQVIASFLAAHPEWRIENASAFVPHDLVEEGGAMRMLPHRHGTDGVYAVRMKRQDEA